MSQALKTIIVQTAIYYGRNLDEQVLEMMAGDLADLDPQKCIQAYAQYRRNPANRAFPLPAQIRELVAPEQYVAIETQAREIAARIIGAIPKFGWANAKEAQAYIGPDGWALVNRAGGWRHLCETTQTKQAPILQAQFRDQLEGSLRYGQAAVEDSVGALDAPRARANAELVRADVMRLLPKRTADADGGDGGAA